MLLSAQPATKTFERENCFVILGSGGLFNDPKVPRSFFYLIPPLREDLHHKHCISSKFGHQIFCFVWPLNLDWDALAFLNIRFEIFLKINFVLLVNMHFLICCKSIQNSPISSCHLRAATWHQNWTEYLLSFICFCKQFNW